MNYPNQPGTPGYPPYQPQNPQGAPGFGYAPPQPYPPQYPLQGYNAQYPPPWQPAGAPAPAQPVLARGTLEDYLDQPTGGGGAATSKFFTQQRPVGSWLQLRVARDLINSDVRQQTDKFGTPLTFKSSGKPKFVLIIPCQVLASNDGSHQNIYPEGQVTVWLKGVPSDSFKQAMSAAGIVNPDKALANGKLGGATFYMIGAGTKQFGNGNPANMFDFQYTPSGREMEENPNAAAPPAPAQQVPPTPAPAQYAAPTPSPAPVSAPQTAAGYPPDPNSYAAAYQQATGQPFQGQQYQQPVPPTPGPVQAVTPPPPAPGQPVAPPQTVTPSVGFAPQGVPAPPQGPPAPPQQYAQPGVPQLDPEKAALLQRLQGQG